MLTEQLQLFVERMSLAARQGGAVARMLQGKVANEGKTTENFASDSDLQAARRSAKTLADEIVQEVLLLAAQDVLDSKNVLLDAEEESASVRYFSSQDVSTSLIIDPIDGTLEYLMGRDDYSVCIGLVEHGCMLSALVYFPVRDQLYFLGADGRGYLANSASSRGLHAAELLKAPASLSSRRIYINSRVPQSVIEDLSAAGYEVCSDDKIACPDAILQCLRGEALAYLSLSRNMRDILLGAILSGVVGGYALDWSGRVLIWPQKGRVPQTLFGVGPMPALLQRCLKGH